MSTLRLTKLVGYNSTRWVSFQSGPIFLAANNIKLYSSTKVIPKDEKDAKTSVDVSVPSREKEIYPADIISGT